MQFLAEGNPTPQFELADQDDNIIKLSDYEGKKYSCIFIKADAWLYSAGAKFA